MKKRFIPLAATLLALCASPMGLAITQPHPYGDGPPDKTLAPTFQVSGKTASQTEVLPLRSTQVQAKISGVIADVTVEQEYQNTGSAPIEAKYIFPASTRAAVHGVEMRLGQRVIKSVIQEKTQAKATYEKAKSQSKSATLLEEHRPNVFEMSVANILPGEVVKVSLHYSEKLLPSNRVYEFIFPSVVGPRYLGGSGNGTGEAWAENPYVATGTAGAATFAMNLELQAGMPLQSIASPSHQGLMQFSGKSSASFTLSPSADHATRDFVLRYQLSGREVATGLLLHQAPAGSGPDAENFFLLNVQPPAKLEAGQTPPRDYLFVLDVSGSMNGFPIETSKRLMSDLLKGLNPSDTFNILHFASDSAVLSPKPLAATPDNIQLATKDLSGHRGNGGTELLPALKRALAMPQEEGVSRSIVILTDGYVTIEKEAFQLVRKELHDANVFTFGIGTSVNRWLIEGLAHAGQGDPFVVLSEKDASAAAERFREYISRPVLTDVQVTYEGFDAYDAEPASIPDVFADRPIELIGKWRGQPQGRIIVRGKTGGSPYEASFNVGQESAKGLTNPALRPLWAKDRVRTLNYELQITPDAKTIKTVTDLGVRYALLTPYTSFVGVDEAPKEILAEAQAAGQPTGAAQPVVVVSSSSKGKTPGAVPEPGVTGLLLLAAASLLMNRQRPR
ncbi:VIT domain-containing protein [Verrucomicrobium sp. BvORR106]|uniref:VIT domain-containing protein n=1 Tax=Verrucomicrobium sp. BvORR106 TaxID=1403819 RepID=UPI0006924E35|nr:VIT domain-containing protein [Verrucomicrobium sp. BvORR106]